jgi:8-oxo-dGTP diphosphatase
MFSHNLKQYRSAIRTLQTLHICAAADIRRKNIRSNIITGKVRVEKLQPKCPLLTVDIVILTEGRVVLIRRANPPFQGMWAIPGGFVDVGERVEAAAVREALEETSLRVALKALVGVYSDPGRDPRGHTVSVVYLAVPEGGALRAADDAKEAAVFAPDDTLDLAFDHRQILDDALRLAREMKLL